MAFFQQNNVSIAPSFPLEPEKKKKRKRNTRFMNLKDHKIYRDQQTANPYRFKDEINKNN